MSRIGKRLADYPAPLVEALCVWETFRRLGFAADDIYFAPRGGLDRDTLRQESAVVLRAQCREFVVTCGPMPGTKEEVGEQWEAFAGRAARREFEKDFDEVYERSHVGRQTTILIWKLLEKGFTISRPS